MYTHNVSFKLKPNTLEMEIIPTLRKQNLYKEKK